VWPSVRCCLVAFVAHACVLQGHVFIRGRRRKGLIGDETKERLRIGMVFQSAAMFDSLTVVENVGFTLYEHSKLPDARIRELVTESLTRVGLSGVEDRYPSQLSGGMKKRAALARAIIVDPTSEDKGVEEVVMYDEPTAGLDPIASTVVEDLMRDLHKKSTGTASSGGISSYIVVTHQHSTIRRATDRLVFLHQGVVVWQGSASEFDTSEEPIVRQFARGELNGPITY
jgi:ABC-type transporter Mla maintaining outer membrane lipid asymmetry ATPase subunit MlaF